MLIRDPTLLRCASISRSPTSGLKKTAAPHIISARCLATRICRLSCAPGRSHFLIRSAAARPGRSARRSHSPPTVISTPLRSSREVNLFGLPAQLSEDARQTSGVGLNARISGGYEARISPDHEVSHRCQPVYADLREEQVQ